MLTQEKLREVLSYDPDTGIFRRAGSEAGFINGRGHRCIQIDGKDYQAGRLAWLYVTGSWPKRGVDHVNLDRADNRWSNLREATRSQSLANTRVHKNNKLGVKGVHQQYRGKFRAQIRVDGKLKHLGTFNTVAEAAEAYERAAIEAFGEYARAS